MDPMRVLVTGASIAGPTAAYWLARAGHEVTVLERAAAAREGGQNIDVRTTGREVIRRMGLEDAIRARNTGEVGTRFLDESGQVASEFPVEEGGEEGPTAELEILRGALAEVLTRSCPDAVTWRHGDEIVALTQDEEGVDVELREAGTERYDLLVVAEGVGSHTRDLVFPGETEERELGVYFTYGTVPRTPADDDFWNFLVVPGSRQVSLRPDDEGTMRAMLNFLSDGPVLDGLDHDALLAELTERFAGLGWETERILSGLREADDLYVDWLRQVQCPTWHRGRVCLVGDAAWCATSMAGNGTSLALTGAYVLAAFLSQAAAGGHEDAFVRYEEWMRPVVEEAQKLPPGVPRISMPQSRAGVQALRWGTRIAATPVARGLVHAVTSSGAGTQRELPDFVETGDVVAGGVR